MTGNRCLLDISVVIHSFKKNNTISEQLDVMTEIYVPVTVIGEWYFGAYKASNSLKHIAQIQAFLSNCSILLSDTVTADLYGNIKAALMLKGKPIPENDIWIAAAARQHNLPLFTTDKHFAEIDNLSLIQ